MKRRFRLTRSTDYKRVRRFGKSYAHPLAVLVVMQSETDRQRIGISASRSVGGAVERNRAKRRLRAAFQPALAGIAPGWDMILIARKPILQAQFNEIVNALLALVKRAGLLKE